MPIIPSVRMIKTIETIDTLSSRSGCERCVLHERGARQNAGSTRKAMSVVSIGTSSPCCLISATSGPVDSTANGAADCATDSADFEKQIIAGITKHVVSASSADQIVSV